MIALVSVALGGACCVGSTSTVPTRLGECEKFTAGLSFTGETAFASWNRKGALSNTATDQGFIATLGAGVRFTRKLSLTADVPARMSHRGGGKSSWGGGIGDASAQLMIDPLDERPDGPVVPIFTVGLRAPTGRDWMESTNPKGSDITGIPGVGLEGGIQLERTLDATPFTVALSGRVPVGAPEVRPLLTASGTLGRYISTSWSVLGGLRHTVDGFGRGRNHRTVASARVVHGRPLAYRFFAGVETDVPAPWVGRSNALFARGSVGAVWVQ